MKQVASSIEKDTPILPWIVSDTVVAELSAYFHNKGMDKEGAIISSESCRLSDYLTSYAQAVYQRSDDCRKQIQAKGNKGRDWLRAFMRHWLSAQIAWSHPDIFRKIPSEFKLGHKLNLKGVEDEQTKCGTG